MAKKQAGMIPSMIQTTGVHVVNRQRLALSAQMRQQLHLLHMPSSELIRFVAREIERNPLLTYLPRQKDGYGQDFSVSDLLDKKSAQQGPTLQEHVREQIIFGFANNQEQHIALYLSEMLDEKGYFEGDLNLMAHELEIPPDLVARVFERCQNFDPPGLFARSLAECLRLQLERQGRFDSTFAKLLQELPLLARRDFARLAQACGVSQNELQPRLEIIKQLNPKPGLVFAASSAEKEAPVIIADAFIESQEDGQHRITLNDAILPKLILNKDYSQIIGTTKEDRQFITHCHTQANGVLRALEARAQTLLKVITAIFSIQKDFLQAGAIGLKPLTLRQIAAAINLHESTISRTIAHKYVTIRQRQAEHGPYRLNYFFSNALHHQSREEAHSARAIEARLIQLINKEDVALSDSALAQLLKNEGIAIARRTVTKYRERLRIAPSHQRQRNKL